MTSQHSEKSRKVWPSPGVGRVKRRMLRPLVRDTSTGLVCDQSPASIAGLRSPSQYETNLSIPDPNPTRNYDPIGRSPHPQPPAHGNCRGNAAHRCGPRGGCHLARSGENSAMRSLKNSPRRHLSIGLAATFMSAGLAVAAVCQICQGSGASSIACNYCKGTGVHGQMKCPTCKGKGFPPCIVCGGSGGSR